MTEHETTRIDGPSVGPNTTLNGMFAIDAKLASGGMGEVYRGHNITTGDPVAIKVVLGEFARDETIIGLFFKEAKVLNSLHHPAIVRYSVFSVDPAIGRPYLVMEYVDGVSLAEAIDGRPMPVAETKSLVARLASALDAAHKAGVIHRDISPDNVILAGGDVSGAKIIDFGIARASKLGSGTLLGDKFAGKYNFVSPEQLGLFGGEVTDVSDIYSLGLLTLNALRGAPVDMNGTPVEVIEKRRAVPDLSDIDAELRPILELMLQPDPADRAVTMADIAEWLAPEAQGHRATPRPAPRTEVERTQLAPRPAIAAREPSPQPVPEAAPEHDPIAHIHIETGPGPQAAAATVGGANGGEKRRRSPVLFLTLLGLLLAGGAGFAALYALGYLGAPQQQVAIRDDEPAETPPQPSDTHVTPEPMTDEAPPKQEASAPPIPVPVPASEVEKPPIGPAEPPPRAEETTAPDRMAMAPQTPPPPQNSQVVPPPAPVAPDPQQQEIAVAPAPEPQAPLPSKLPAASDVQSSPVVPATPTPTPPAVQAPVSVPAPPQSPPTQQSSRVMPPPTPQALPAPPSSQELAVAKPPPAPTPPTDILVDPKPPVVDATKLAGERLDWLKTFDAGKCFFAHAVASLPESMEIEGFGTDAMPFEKLDAGFTGKFGFSPDIQGRQISKAQCGVAEFLTALSRIRQPSVPVTLAKDRLRNGDSLEGSLRDLTKKTTVLYLIDNDGFVYRLDGQMTRTNEDGSFRIEHIELAGNDPMPQIVLVLSSDSVVPGSQITEPAENTLLFRKLAETIASHRIDVDYGFAFFTLGGP